MLIAARAEAESARQARNQFALTVSHELLPFEPEAGAYQSHAH